MIKFRLNKTKNIEQMINIRPYIELSRLNKPIGIYLLLWPTLTALWIANEGFPGFKLFFIFTLGVILTRSAGCIINDYADRDFDAHVERSKNRPLANKTISSKSALLLFFLLLLLALILVLQTNLLSIALSLVAALLMIIYPFMKRFTHAPQLFLGLAFAWGAPMAFTASTNQFNVNSLWLMVFIIAWAVVYDTIYAMVDMEDDLKIGIKSTAILFYPKQQLMIAGFQLIMIFGLMMTAYKFNLSASFYLGIFAIVPLMVYHQWLIKDGNKDLCFKAFLNNHWIGLIIFIFTVFAYF